MATKIRLQRHGRKGYAYYHIVIADSRAPRDGKFIERIGSYNPNTNPATIDLKFDRALYWVVTGAQPTDTVNNILSNEGVLLKKHLLEGVRKGAFDEAAAEAKFEAWKADKEKNKEGVKANALNAKETEAKQRLDAEKEINKAKVAEAAKKRADALAAEAAKNAPKVEAEVATEEEIVAPEVEATETPAAE